MQLEDLKLAFELKRMQQARSTAYSMGGETDSLASASGGIGSFAESTESVLGISTFETESPA